MKMDYYTINDFLKPQIIAEEREFLVVYKPPRMHSSPQTLSTGENLLEYVSREFIEIKDLPGRREGEAGLLNRLDFETHGLILIARTLTGMEMLLHLQSEGKIIKEYSAVTSISDTVLPGFPAPMHGEDNVFCFLGIEVNNNGSHCNKVPPPNDFPFSIRSAFRPYGRGRKEVRPVSERGIISAKKRKSRDFAFDHGGLYTTDILEMSREPMGRFSLRLKISRGFRHQIRSHLAWMRMPILNDKLYGGAQGGKGFLGLRSCSIVFTYPPSQKEIRFSIPDLNIESL